MREPLIDPLDELQLALDVAAVPHHPLDDRLHDYQERGVKHLHAHPRSALFLVPGLGKTATTLSALTEVHLPVLVVAPKRVVTDTWPAEIGLWRPDLTYSVIRGNKDQRLAKLQEDTDIHIISRDTFGDDLAVKRAKVRYKTVIIDELSGFKNRASKRWKHMNRIVKDVPYVWGLTGTPMPNSYIDLWSQIFLLDRGARLERTITAFRSKYFLPGKRLPNGVITDWTLRPYAEEVIQDRIKDICMSVSPENYTKIPVNESYHYFDLPKPVRKAYDVMHDAFVAEIGEKLVSVEHAAAKSNKLLQIASGFMYHSGLVGTDESEEAEITHHHMLKMEILQEIIDEAQGAPILVFYRFEEDRRRLLHLPGAVDVKTPHATERWNRGNIPILITHPASAAHGLNLQHGGNIMVWYGLTWSSEEYTQGNGRLARQGQKNPVAIHHILGRDTVDELQLDVVKGRITRQDALLKLMEK